MHKKQSILNILLPFLIIGGILILIITRNSNMRKDSIQKFIPIDGPSMPISNI